LALLWLKNYSKFVHIERLKVLAQTLQDDPKKIFAREEVFKRNQWLKCRLLFGVNVRADIAAVLSLKLVKTAYAAAKLLGCAPNTAYRNWAELKESGWPNKLSN